MVTFFTDKQALRPAELVSFIYSIDDDFTPRLSARICVENWVSKFFPIADIIYAKDEEAIIAMIVVYANDMISRKGYITFIGTSSKYRSLGIGTELLNISFDIMKKRGISSVELHTNNEKAAKLYMRCGFKLIDHAFLDGSRVIRYHLERVL